MDGSATASCSITFYSRSKIIVSTSSTTSCASAGSASSAFDVSKSFIPCTDTIFYVSSSCSAASFFSGGIVLQVSILGKVFYTPIALVIASGSSAATTAGSGSSRTDKGTVSAFSTGSTTGSVACDFKHQIPELEIPRVITASFRACCSCASSGTRKRNIIQHI